MTYFFETYGCQMNKAESSSLEQLLIERGWTLAEEGEQNADLIIINTCSVRATAETRIHGRLGFFTSLRKERRKQGRDFTLVVTGCMAERLKEELQKQFPVVDYVVGTFQKAHFNDIIDAVAQKRKLTKIDEDPVYEFAALSYEKGSFKAYLPIMHGCNNFCTYCIVPYVRGREVSRSPKAILDELDLLNKRGVKEVTLLGQNVNSYIWKNPQDQNASLDFPGLMQLIADHLRDTSSSIGWVRFLSSHPKDLSDRLIEVIAKEDVICKHIHLPVQHGSTEILKAMNRRYSREDYLALVARIRKRIPDVSLTTDVMLGFPGETEEDFEDTVSLMKEVGYETAFMYYYNPREGTKAAEMQNQIPLEVKKERLAKIIDLQQEITKSQMKKRLGSKVKVLVESVSRDDPEWLLARTQQDECVVFKAEQNLIGNFVTCELNELTGNTFRGKLL